MLYSVFQSIANGQGISMATVIAQLLASLFVVFLILPFHEFAHGWAANKLGDPTAKYAGRLTLNPLASFDAIGTLGILLFGIGWAKPVPVNPRNFKNPKKDMALTAFAGPLANLLASLISGILLNVVLLASGGSVTFGTYVPSAVVTFFINFFLYCMTINISLAVFNLLPIPPLDGSRIIGIFLSSQAAEIYYRYENVIMWIFMIVVFFGGFNGILYPLQRLFAEGIMHLANLPFLAFGL
ncbi:MAG: site-2 protease family protein [Oscillospiraceae bacterium]|nr:site-2 protease family protein [Oscillospiraceae bacterium]